MSLLSDSEGSGDEVKVERLKVNAKFADRFEKSERVKDLHRAKELAKRGAFDENEESDSESETEDEDAELLSTGLDLKIIQTINSLRKKDPKIYDQTTKWFDPRNSSDSDSDDEDAAPKASKKKKYKDVLREQLLESEAAGGLGNGDGIETATRGVRDTASRNTLVYDAEQEKIRQAFIKSAGGKDSKKSKKVGDSSDEEEEEDILQVKSKTPQELKAEEAELKMALKEMRELTAKNSKDDQARAKPASKNKTAILETEEADGGDSFLVNYLEKGLWKEKASKSRRKAADSESEEDIEEDEAELEQMDRFESKYNFRFEELADQQARNGGAEVSGLTEVTGHARDVQGSMRRVDDKRKAQRESRKERKEKERRQQEAELRRLKNLKRQELTERLKQIGQMSGLLDEDEGEDIGKSLKLNEDFLDEDWDPEKHEALMAAQFGDDYYGEDDADFNVADMADIEAYEEYLNGDDIAGDDGYDYDNEEEGDGEEPAYENIVPKGLKGKAREEYKKNAASMADELYQLDYEDIVAGLPCRFKYKQVEKEGFGLTAEDILLADDSELNKYVSLKKISAYSTGSGVTDGDLTKKRKRLRENVKERLAKEAEEAEAKGLQVKGTKPKPKGAAAAVAVTEEAEEEPEESYPGDGADDGDKKRKRKRRKGTGNAASSAEVVDVASVHKRDTRPESSASKPKPSAEAREAAKAAEKAQEKANSKEKKKIKAKKSSRKKEESEMDKRLGLYN